MSPEILHSLAVWIFLAVIAITFHEAAHGIVAYWCGDNTAKRQGRVTLNPIKHIDTFGTLILPIAMRLTGVPFTFGWAKPVPVDYRNLRNPRRDSALVALAGPAANFILAFIFLVLIAIFSRVEMSEANALLAQELLVYGLILNVAFGLFNLLPFPPLDGSKVLMSVLPGRYAIMLARLEPYGLIIVLGGLFILPLLLQQVGVRFDPMHYLLVKPLGWIVNTMIGWVG